MDNLTKTADQLLPDFCDFITSTHTPKSFYEAKGLLEIFREFLVQVPPSTDLAVKFLTRFKDCKPNTRAHHCLCFNY